MDNEHNEQTQWLVSYLETRFGKLEDSLRYTTSNLQVRLDSVAEGLEDRLDRATDRVDQVILAQSERVAGLEKKLDQVEGEQVRLSSQAGFLKNILAFIGTIVLSLVGWLVSYWFSSGPK